MSEHKGLPVHGYQPQSDSKVVEVNVNKVLEERVLRRIEELQKLGSCDPRFLAIGRTGIEQAFMAINRAVFQPGRVALPEDAEGDPPG